MESSRDVIILFCIGLYFASCIGVGIWALRRTHSTRDFFMAGRDLGIFVTGLAIFSSTLSGFGFVGGPGLVYRMGMSSLWMVVCASIGYVLAFYLLGKRLRVFAEVRESITLPDVVAARYGKESTRFFTALAILLGVMGYLATQILAMAIGVAGRCISQAVAGDISLTLCVCDLPARLLVLVYLLRDGRHRRLRVHRSCVQGADHAGRSAAGASWTAISLPSAAASTEISQVIHADDPAAIGPVGDDRGALGGPLLVLRLRVRPRRASPTSLPRR